MKNKKLITSVLTLGLLVGGVVVARAINLGGSYLSLNPNDNFYAEDVDPYVTTQIAGTIYEGHYVSRGATPTTFKADLEFKTVWYKPNDVKDTSRDPNGWNKTTCNKGQQYRTHATATVMVNSRVETAYDNY